MRVFISYNNRDQAIAERFDAALGAALPNYRGYFAPRSNIGGAYWLPLLGEELGQSDGVLLLLGNSVGSWQELEYYEALRLSRTGRPWIMPVLLGEDSPGLHFLGQFHRLRLQRQSFEALIDELKAAFEGADTPADAVPLWRDTNPYRGLQAMGSADAAFFFGRENLTCDIIGLLRSRRGRVLTLVGNSGVGKSSIVEAGVFAALRSRLWPGNLEHPWPDDLADSRSWLFLTMRPGEHPLRTLALAFVRCWLDDPADVEAQTLKWVENFRNGSELGALVDATRQMITARSDAAAPSRILLHVDQGEELYLRSEEDEAKRFSRLIAQAAGREGLAIMASLRADHYGQLQDDAALFPVCDRVDVPPLGPDGIEAVIRKPVARLGARFENPEIVPLIVEATARESGALPLLSFMMTEAWQKMRLDEKSDGALRFPAGVIDVAGPLVRRAEQFVELNYSNVDTLRRLFALRLAHVPVTGEPVRRRATQDDCTADEWVLAQELATADWRLLTAGRQGDMSWIEVAHETLLRKWPRLIGWIDAERAFLIWKGQMEADRREWEAAPQGSKDEAVLMGLALANAERWYRERKDDLSKQDAAFIERSMKLDEDRKDAEASRRRWLTRIGMAASVIFATLLASIAWKWDEAERANVSLANQLFENRKEQARFRAATAEALLRVDRPDAALAVAVEAFPEDRPDEWVALDAASNGQMVLFEAYHSSRLFSNLIGHESWVSSAAFSPKGDRIITSSGDGTARIWDTASGALTITLNVKSWVNGVSFSSHGELIATSSSDKMVRIWDATSGEILKEMPGHRDGVGSAVFSPQGNRIVSASGDGTARIWDVESGTELRKLNVHEGEGRVRSAAFSFQGDRVVTASEDGAARVWDAGDGTLLLTLTSYGHQLYSASFSPNGDHIVTASGDGTARIWDAVSGTEIRKLTGHKKVVTSSAFSPKGDRIVTASVDGTARIWDAITGQAIETLTGHKGEVSAAVFSAQGDRIVTASEDGTARIWNANNSRLVVLKGHSSDVYSAAFSPHGDQIVTASKDSMVKTWNASDGTLFLTLAGHKSEVNTAAFSPLGDRIVTASDDKSARVWSAIDGKPLLSLTDHDGKVYDAAFSRQGDRIVTAADDRYARVWDAVSGKQLYKLIGHTARVSSAEFSHKGDRIVTASIDDTVRIWDAKTGKILRTWPPSYQTGGGSAAFSPAGDRIITVSDDKAARVWNARSGELLMTLSDHDDVLTSASFSEIGDRIVTASNDGTARVWDAESGVLLMKLTGHKQYVNSAALSPQGDRIVTASGDGTAQVWTNIASLPELVNAAREKVNRNRVLSAEEECRYSLRVEGCG